MENLARYIIYPEGHTRASFSQERMQYLNIMLPFDLH